MEKDSLTDSVVVRQVDGTLAVRETNTLVQDIQPRKPYEIGNLDVGSSGLTSLYVSGRYVYIIDDVANEFLVIDATDVRNPQEVGSVAIGVDPQFLFVSGRYAYVVGDDSDDIKIIDISDPSNPVIKSSLIIGGDAESVYVSGHYAYVVDNETDDLRIIDVTDSSNPVVVGSLVIGAFPKQIQVSGRYAYIIDGAAEDLKIIDVSDPTSPSIAGTLGIGQTPTSLYVSGRYAYIVDSRSDDLKVVDVSDPSNPVIAGTLGNIGSVVNSVFVSGRYAYVIDQIDPYFSVIDVIDPSNPVFIYSLDLVGTPHQIFVAGKYGYIVDKFARELRIFDISGIEAPAVIAHSLEAGNLQVRNDIIAQGQLQVTSGINVGAGGIFSDGNVGIAGELTLNTSGHSETEGIVISGDDITQNVAITLENKHLDGRSYSISSGGGLLSKKGKWFLKDETAGVDRMVIDSSGNIGFGIDDPSSFLTLQGPGATHPVGITQNQVGGSSGMEFTTTDAGGEQATRILLRGSDDNSDVVFYRGGRGAEEITLTIEANGNVGIDTPTPTRKLDVNGNARFRMVGSGAFSSSLNITSDGSLTTSTSDRRLKENINHLSNPLETVQSLQGVSFNWKGDKTKERRIGLIAQEVAAVVPELTFTNPVDEYMGVRYQDIPALLIEAVKELSKTVEEQQSIISNLQAQLDQLSLQMESED